MFFLRVKVVKGGVKSYKCRLLENYVEVGVPSSERGILYSIGHLCEYDEPGKESIKLLF